MALKSLRTDTLNRVSDINGLVHINSASGTAVTAINLDDVFSATFSQYKVIINIEIASNVLLLIRFRTGGVTNTTGNYNTQSLVANATGVTAIRPDTSATSARLSNASFTENGYANSLEIRNPFSSTNQTNFISLYGTQNSTSAALLTGSFTTDQSFDGLSIFTSSTNFTGSISVLGYKD